jgi:FkbM family methyltransferase
MIESRTPESLFGRLARRVGWAVRDAWPDRAVVRDVQGVRMTLPWSHRLPDYARVIPAYGQNLVRLAELLGAGEKPLTVLDVGANVGDSTLQILAATDATVLAVEADGFFLDYLHRNVDGDPRVTVQESLLTTGASDVPMAPVRVGGTTRFEPGTSDLTASSVTTDELRTSYPAFDSLRLAKCDTDGYDVELIPAIARTWADSTPVLFFEYDHVLSRHVGNDPLAVWAELRDQGYTSVVAWDNYGEPVGHFAIDDVPAAAAVLDEPTDERAHPYWDVAVVHGSDEAGLKAIASLVPAA